MNVMRWLSGVIAAVMLIVPVNGAAQETMDNPARKKIAVVIDDFGNGMKGTQAMIDMPVKLTVAVMPFLPTTERDAELAHAAGHDVIVHMPMEPKQGKPSWLGPGALMADMTDEQVRDAVQRAIDDVPHAVGMNNHMGSKIIEDERMMRIVLEVCKERGLFFLDSNTSIHSVVPQIAKQIGLPIMRNVMFFDHVGSRQHMAKQIHWLGTYMDEHENCIAIGHVGVSGELMSDALRHCISLFADKYEFVGISALVSDTYGNDFFSP